MNYSLGMPYEDKGASFRTEDVLDHIDNNLEKPNDRDGYKFVSTGIDWGRMFARTYTNICILRKYGTFPFSRYFRCKT